MNADRLQFSLRRDLEAALQPGALHACFQPIIDLRAGRIFGYEGLSRGPFGSCVEAPGRLFELAFQLGRLYELESLAVDCLIKRFVALQLPGVLFLNLTPHTLVHHPEVLDDLRLALQTHGFEAGRLVLELTETHAFREESLLLDRLQSTRALGIRIALDDLGDGFASLKRWSLIQPDVVKVDRHFVHGVAADPVRQQFLRGIVTIADSTGCLVVGEGVEDAEDLAELHRLGVALAQGYLIARPAPEPSSSEHDLLPKGLRRVAELRGQRPEPAGEPLRVVAAAGPGAESFARTEPAVLVTATCAEVAEVFQRNPSIQSVPVLDPSGVPAGILRGLETSRMLSRPYFLDLYGKRSCRVMMDESPLIFDAAEPMQVLSEAILRLDERHYVDGFIVTREGRYLGMGRVGDVLRAAHERQLAFARYANPLTGLPGNVPIDEEIERRLEAGVAFVVVYWDISHFKAYNDLYGYREGDDLIRLTADLLRPSGEADGCFIGHIGGDDFVSLLSPNSWELIVKSALAAFDERVRAYLRADHLAAGGYEALDRRGENVFHALPSLAAGVLLVYPGQYESHLKVAQAASDAKRIAKKQGTGSSYFIERRLV